MPAYVDHFLKGLFLSAVLFVFALVRAEAADIRVDPSPSGKAVIITVEGELLSGDEKKFTQIALQNDMAVVLFSSPGGSTLAGVEIGRAIRLKGYFTAVSGGALCASACGYAWLGGVKRFMERSSKIGFHASYVRENGINKESGVGNALVGAYLNSLGLSQYAIAYISTAGPDAMTWMRPEDAADVGIEVQVVDANGDPEKPQSEKLPMPDDDSIVVAPLGPPPNGPSLTVSPSTPPKAAEVRARVMSRMAGVDIFGHDLPGMPLKNVTEAQCEEACVADTRCRAFTFNIRHNVCFLKSGGERVFRNPGATAGYMSTLETRLRQSNIIIMERTDYPGNDYEELRDVEFGACSDSCERDERCLAFTYMAKRKRCWLKEDVSEPVRSRLTISGVKG